MHRVIKNDDKLATSKATHRILIDQELEIDDGKKGKIFFHTIYYIYIYFFLLP